ncbi:MAG TPA: hypothetical protein PKW80_12700 [Bacteroidales bacterium]|nr:hypothetical protein [Bacteroidales bacterium]
MKTIKIFCLAALLVPLWGYSQSKSSITIKSITIENGDTIVKERHYNSDGNGIIFDDSIFGDNNQFIFFNNDYDIDTNFSEKFHEIFSREMNDFFQDFNHPLFDMPDNPIDFYKKSFPLNFDSVFSDEDQVHLHPDTTDASRNKAKSVPPQALRKKSITAENIILPYKQPVDEFLAEPGYEQGSVKIVFQLDQQKNTQLSIKDESKKTIYKEKIPRSKGIYTRLFDFSVYPSGIYFLELRQGKKSSVSRIYKKGNNNYFDSDY